jgi:hypothetical protein
MDDSFSFGDKAKARTYTPREQKSAPSAATGSFQRSRLVLGGFALVVVGLLVWGFLHFMGSAGNEVAADQQRVVDQVGNAQDVQAQLTGTQAVQGVQMLHAQGGSFAAVTPEALKAFEPAFTYSEQASTSANAVSVASSGQGVGLAVLSASGTCLYAHVDASGVQYGTGSTCTGTAAMSASDASWPAAT